MEKFFDKKVGQFCDACRHFEVVQVVEGKCINEKSAMHDKTVFVDSPQCEVAEAK
jgi:hypothetical protein